MCGRHLSLPVTRDLPSPTIIHCYIRLSSGIHTTLDESEPLPTPRGGCPDYSKIPRVADPMPTPRGGRPDSAGATREPPAETPRGTRPAEAAPPEPAPKKPKEGTRGELYAYPEWEQLSMFDQVPFRQ